jgi:hypothetical protein
MARTPVRSYAAPHNNLVLHRKRATAALQFSHAEKKER